MSPVHRIAYLAMSVWLVLAAGRRIAITLADGLDIDAITVISAAIGILALLLLLPTWDERKTPQ